MPNPDSPQALLTQALAAFPHPLETIEGVEVGWDEDGTRVGYVQEVHVRVGHLLDMALIAGGYLTLRQAEGEEPYVDACLVIACEGDWERGRILPEETSYQGAYDFETGCWNFWFDRW